MNKSFFNTLLVSLALASTPQPLRAQQFEYAKQAEFDDKGNIYVSSDQGKLIWMANTKHCSEARVANDQQTVGCLVVSDPALGNSVPSIQLEIYRKGGYKEIIQPEAPILEWHFWKDGQEVAVFSSIQKHSGTFSLYDTRTGRLIEKLAEPSNASLLPQWAKDQAQIQDESVPMSATLNEERMKWIGKVLRQIGTIEPGMRRKDLFTVFKTEGGLSFRTQQTYVHIECPYIKVNVRFKPVDSENAGVDGDPNDVIESISQPYLAWSVMD